MHSDSGCSKSGHLPAAAEVEALVLPEGGALRGLMSWTRSFGAGNEGVDSISKNLTNISENDCKKQEVDSESRNKEVFVENYIRIQLFPY